MKTKTALSGCAYFALNRNAAEIVLYPTIQFLLLVSHVRNFFQN